MVGHEDQWRLGLTARDLSFLERVRHHNILEIPSLLWPKSNQYSSQAVAMVA
jgi:hypothetical protein